MKLTRARARDGAKTDGGRAAGAELRGAREYAKPVLTSYGNLVELTRTSGGGDPDGLIGTIGT